MRFVSKFYDWGYRYSMAVQRGPWRHGVTARRSYGHERIPFKIKVQSRQRLRAWAVRTATEIQWKQRIMRGRRRGELS